MPETASETTHTTKGGQTRQRIVEEAAQLFSRQGYFGVSLSDIMEATDLEKGGIYNHFENKDAIALAAFDYSVKLLWRLFTQALEGKTNAVDRLLASVAAFRTLARNPPLPGGCPLLNTAVEADDAHPLLRQRVRAAMDHWRGTLRDTVAEGIARGEIRPDVDGDALASLIIATLEGAVMLTKLYDDANHMSRAADHLTQHIEQAVRAR
jgi:TetR/AcrR family transcriptional regulator, transcriptional repressor for nem operon